MSERLDAYLEALGVPTGAAEPVAYVLVIGLITYVSVIIGELVPKHLALRDAEGIACAVAPSMTVVSRVAAPVVSLFDVSTRAIFRLFGATASTESAITDEEIRTVVAEAESAGVIETDERRMISGVFRLGDRAVRGVMTPRTYVDWIDLSDFDEEIREELIRTAHSRLPAADGDADNMLGVVQLEREANEGMACPPPWSSSSRHARAFS